MSQEFVVVAGGAGFVGSHLCDRLIADGHRVLALDDFSTGDASHLDALHDHPRFALQRADIVAPLPPAVDEATLMFNLACPASPAHYQREPVQTTLTSAVGMWRLLEVAERTGARLLQTSTSEVYGDPLVHPQAEDYWGHVNPIGVRSCYDEGKRCAEALAFAYHRERHVDIRVARLATGRGCGRATAASSAIAPHMGRRDLVQCVPAQGMNVASTAVQRRP